jgi:OOP family OmpA-OmpF porin
MEINAAAMPDGNGGSPLEELRSIIVGPEQSRIEELEERLESVAPGAEEISRVLPAAISVSATRDDRLRNALAPLVEGTIHSSVRRNPQPLADAIFPIIGPAIRKAISAAMSGLVQTMNQALEHTFSIRGLRWRAESLRTGVSFGEIVLRHSLLYRVEQVFLIHREGGLLLLHVADRSVPELAPEMIAGMLSAIQDFARDSFKVGSRETLETMQVGELNVLVEEGPHAQLAAVVRGHPPVSLKSTLQETLETVHLMFGDDLVLFQGDSAGFDRARPLLERCLGHEVAPPAARGRWRFWLLAAAVVAGLALWLIPRTVAHRRWERFVRTLQTEPGIVVTETGRRDGKFYVAALRDPGSRDPATLLAAAGLSPDEVVENWEPYYSLDTAFILPRATALLAPPATVALSFAAGVLSASGSAPNEWIQEARRSSRILPGVISTRLDGVRNRGPASLASEIAAVERQEFYYPVGDDQPNAATLAAVPALARQIRAIERASAAQGLQLTITIVGQTDETGDTDVNTRLGRARAERMRSLLTAAGAGARFVANGADPGVAAGNTDPTAQARRRRVTFSADFVARE